MSIHVLYHSPCPDGTAAAAAVLLALGDKATYHPTNYSNTKPEIPDGSEVYFVDFSWPRADLDELAKRSKSVVVLDHHKSAADALAHLSKPAAASYPIDLTAIFDQTRAGCQIAWDYFHPGTKRPWMIERIADRDLWRFALPETKKFAAWLQIQPSAIDSYGVMIRAMEVETVREAVLDIGEALLGQQDALVERINSHAYVTEIMGADGGNHDVIAVNTSLYPSEACDALLKATPWGVAAAWYQAKNGDVRWSLRARKGGVDVSAIAVHHGGGGHRAAAGFVVRYSSSMPKTEGDQ
jgi:nanoRNase/pAp phosphatase (c-di-AMP/oligoRNAs hydrolase)